MDKVQKSTKVARGSVTCDNTTMHLLKANDFVAESIRKRMAAQNTLMINITSSAGSGKTTLLQETARRIGSKINMKVLVGDLETERDADRLRDAGVDAVIADARDVNPNIGVMQISSTSDIGIDQWCNWLLERVEEKQTTATAAEI